MEISRRWGKLTGEPDQEMMQALVWSFWRGAFEIDGESLVFTLMSPNGPVSPTNKPLEELPGQYASGGPHEGNAITKVGDDGEHRLTAERRKARIRRRDVAVLLGGTADCVPWPWDGTEEGLAAYATVPYVKWPLTMQKAHFERWRLGRTDFAKWYARSGAWPKPPLDSLWPDPVNRDPQVVTLRTKWISLNEALSMIEATAADGWEKISTAALRSEIRLRGLVDGVDRQLQADWLNFLAWDHPEERDTLWFDRQAARRKGIIVPTRVENVVVDFQDLGKLWPESAGEANADTGGHVERPRPASTPKIHAAIVAVYDKAADAGAKPPNIKELVKPVQTELAAEHLYASGRRIQELAESPKHAQRRRKPGKTVASELSHKRQRNTR